MQSLQILELWNNQLKSLPPSIVSLQNLRELQLYKNRLISLSAKLKEYFIKLQSNGGHISGISRLLD
ncbi:MAG: leucine-rich repeat domain-containing protein [Candidatus Hermodarchaeota archaeon]